jgi:hypothetical protein
VSEKTFDLRPWEWPTGPGAARFYDLQCELERNLQGRRCVFLDVNFWIDCRDAKFDLGASPDKQRLYMALLRAVGDHRLVCPISSDILTELTKQDDDAFAATMAVIDELTLGVAMVPHRERLIIEVERFLGGFSGVLAALHRPIWTAFVFAFGYQDLWPPGPVARSDELLLTMTDIGWGWPPSKGVSALRRAVTNAKQESERVAETLNRGAEANRGDATGYTAILRDELTGAADLISGHLAAEYDRMAASAGAPPSDKRLRQTLTRMAALGMAKSEGRKAFGNIVVPATLHAAFRAEKGRRFKPNDVFDFRHAAAALPNCDAFFTEGKLSRLMASGHVGLAKSYPCRIAATPGDALKTLQSMDLI